MKRLSRSSGERNSRNQQEADRHFKCRPILIAIIDKDCSAAGDYKAGYKSDRHRAVQKSGRHRAVYKSDHKAVHKSDHKAAGPHP